MTVVTTVDSRINNLQDQVLFRPDQYQLQDFGNGLKVELFSGITVIRPSPAADYERPQNSIPIHSDPTVLRHLRAQKLWQNTDLVPIDWRIVHGRINFRLRPTPFGHLGVFCEQAENWDWIEQLPFDLTGLHALNLFAYTGGTTMALAQRGADVVHVDSARNIVQWAKTNAENSNLGRAAIRWIVDDAMKFVQREFKRGRKYDILVADPPAFGHGGRKMSWKFGRDIGPLFDSLSRIAAAPLTAVLFSCHSKGMTGTELRELSAVLPGIKNGGNPHWGPLDLHSRDRRRLNCGDCFRWHR